MRTQMIHPPSQASRTTRFMAACLLALGCGCAAASDAVASDVVASASAVPDGVTMDSEGAVGPAPAGDTGNGTVVDVSDVLAQPAAAPGVGPAAPVQLWVYVDGQGIAHYANERLDSRYARFSMGPMRAHDAPLHVDVLTPRLSPMDAGAGKGVIVSAQAQALAQRRIQAQHQGYQRNAKHLQAAAQRYNVDAALLRAIASAESGFNPHAVSHKGAVGLMQIMPGTAERFGVSGDAKRSLEQKLKDPAVNAPIAARYVRYLQTLFPGRPDLVLASYNAGEGAVKRYGNKIPPFKETQNYVQIVMATYASLNPQPPRLAGDSTSTIVAGNEAAYSGSVAGSRVRAKYASPSP